MVAEIDNYAPIYYAVFVTTLLFVLFTHGALVFRSISVVIASTYAVFVATSIVNSLINATLGGNDVVGAVHFRAFFVVAVCFFEWDSEEFVGSATTGVELHVWWVFHYLLLIRLLARFGLLTAPSRRAVVVLASMYCTGNLVAATYVIVALHKSSSNVLLLLTTISSLLQCCAVLKESKMMSQLDGWIEFALAIHFKEDVAATPEDTPLWWQLFLTFLLLRVSVMVRRRLFEKAALSTLRTVQGPVSGTCPICLEEFSADAPCKKLSCGHLIHTSCLRESMRFNMACPLCRQAVVRTPRGTIVPTPSSLPPPTSLPTPATGETFDLRTTSLLRQQPTTEELVVPETPMDEQMRNDNAPLKAKAHAARGRQARFDGTWEKRARLRSSSAGLPKRRQRK